MSLHSEYLSNIADGSNSVTSAPQTSFTLFLGELYLQFGETLPLPDAEKKRVPELAEALRSLLSAHVKKGKDNLKIVEQTLQVELRTFFFFLTKKNQFYLRFHTYRFPFRRLVTSSRSKRE